SDDLLPTVCEVHGARIAYGPQLEEVDQFLDRLALANLLAPRRRQIQHGGPRAGAKVPAAGHQEILGNRELREQLQVLETSTDAEMRHVLGAGANDFLSEHADGTGRGAVDAG